MDFGEKLNKAEDTTAENNKPQDTEQTDKKEKTNKKADKKPIEKGIRTSSGQPVEHKFKKKFHLLKRDVSDPNTLFARVLLLPSLLGVFIFFIAPFLIVIYYSIVDNPISRVFVGVNNYKNLVGTKAFIQAATNTMKLSFTAVPLVVILSLLLAALMDSKIPGKSAFRTFFISPMMVPIASIVLIWQVVFSYKGTANIVLSRILEKGIPFGVDSYLIPPWEAVDWFKSPKCFIAVILLFLWKNLGYNMILFLSGLNNIPKDLLEVANLEGAGPVWRMVHIKFRYLSPTFLFVTILSLINSFKLYREIYLLTGQYPYEGLYMLQHFMYNNFLTLDYQKLSSAAIVMGAVMVVVIGALFLVEAYFGKDMEE